MSDLDTVRDVPNAEMYDACATSQHHRCPAGRPNSIPVEGRCDCQCHSPLPPV